MWIRSGKNERCFTDGNGPDVFQKCALEWISPDETGKDPYNRYEYTDGHGRCSRHNPPSAHDKVCKSFHEKIAELKYDG